MTPWTVACLAPLSMGFPRQEYWSGLPFPSPGDLSHPGIKPAPPALAGGFFTTKPPGKPVMILPSKFNKVTYFESVIVILNANQWDYLLRCHGTPL